MRVPVLVLVIIGSAAVAFGLYAATTMAKQERTISEYDKKTFSLADEILSLESKIKEKDALILKSASGNKDLVASTKLYVGAMEEEKAQIEKKSGDLLKENTDLKFQVENLVLGIKEERENKEAAVVANQKMSDQIKSLTKQRDDWKLVAQQNYVAAENNKAIAIQSLQEQYLQHQQPPPQTPRRTSPHPGYPTTATDQNGNRYDVENVGGEIRIEQR